MSKHATHPAMPRGKHHTIAFKAPGAKSVVVTGSFCGWDPHGHPLRRDPARGVWTAILSLPPGRYEYRLLVDGQWQDDPGCEQRARNPFGGENCVFEVR
jgi:1,4-alpha-glucan branching enzyme